MATGSLILRRMAFGAAYCRQCTDWLEGLGIAFRFVAEERDFSSSTALRPSRNPTQISVPWVRRVLVGRETDPSPLLMPRLSLISDIHVLLPSPYAVIACTVINVLLNCIFGYLKTPS